MARTFAGIYRVATYYLPSMSLSGSSPYALVLTVDGDSFVRRRSVCVGRREGGGKASAVKSYVGGEWRTVCASLSDDLARRTLKLTVGTQTVSQ